MKELKIERNDLTNSVDGTDMVSGCNHIKVRKNLREEFDFINVAKHCNVA